MVKNPPANAGDLRDVGLIPGSGRFLGGGRPTPIVLPRESHGQRSQAGYSPSGHKQSDVTEVTAHVYAYNKAGIICFHYSMGEITIISQKVI